MAVRTLSALERLRRFVPFAEAFALAVALGRLSAFAYAPAEWWWVAILVPACGIVLLRGRSPRVAFGWGWLYGWISLLASLDWVYVRAADFLGDGMLGIAAVASAIEALPIALAAAAFAFASRRSALALFLGAPALYALLETARASGPFALPLATLGVAQTPGPLAGTIATFGVPFATFACVGLATALGTSIVAALTGETAARRDALAALAAYATIVVACGLSFRSDLARPRHVVARAGIVEAGPIGLGESFGVTADRYADATRRVRGRGVTFALWPEGVLFLTASDAVRQRAAVRRAARSAGVPVLAGATLRDRGVLRNVLLEVRPDGATVVRYAKRKLVPFGEYRPFAFGNADANRAYTTGTGPPLVPSPVAGGAAYGPLICYEVAFAGVARSSADAGAAYLVAILNDSWFGGTGGPEQQTQLTRARAIEEGLDVVHADAVPPSGLIEPSGAWASPPLEGNGVTIVDVRSGVTAPFRSIPSPAIPIVLAACSLALARRGRAAAG